MIRGERTHACSGAASISRYPKPAGCYCRSSFCSSDGWSYVASMPSLPGLVNTTTLANSCGSTAWTITLTSGFTCSAASCQLQTGTGCSNCYFSTSCSGSSGYITTGYIAQLLYATSDTSCTTVIKANVYNLGVCQVISSSMSLYVYSDSSGYPYTLTYPNNACRYYTIINYS